jgi:hypothetical protein
VVGFWRGLLSGEMDGKYSVALSADLWSDEGLRVGKLEDIRR